MPYAQGADPGVALVDIYGGGGGGGGGLGSTRCARVNQPVNYYYCYHDYYCSYTTIDYFYCCEYDCWFKFCMSRP